MKNKLTDKTAHRWTQNFAAKFPLAFKHFATYFSKTEQEVIAHVFSHLNDEDCRAKLKKFFFYQKVLDLQDADFTHDAMKKHLDDVFPQAELRYAKKEEDLRLQSKRNHDNPKSVAVKKEPGAIGHWLNSWTDADEVWYLDIIKKAGLEPIHANPRDIERNDSSQQKAA